MQFVENIKLLCSKLYIIAEIALLSIFAFFIVIGIKYLKRFMGVNHNQVDDELAQIKKDINNKKVSDIIDSLNTWLS